METIAQRAFTSRKPLQRIETGDHGVSIGIYAAVLNALGLLDWLATIAAPENDDVGMQLAGTNLPKWIREKVMTEIDVHISIAGSTIKTDRRKGV